MAKLSGQKLYVGKIDLSAVAYDVNWTMGVETPPDADFADTAAVVMAGLNTAQISGNARYTTGASGTDQLLSVGNGTLIGPVSLVFGSVEGDAAFSVESFQSNYSTATGAAGDKHQVAWATVPGGDLVIGQLLALQTAATTSGNSTGLDLDVLAAGYRMYSILHVVSGSGGNLTVELESDVATWVSPVTRITHTVATGPTSQVLTLDGAVATDDLWRSKWTISAGTFSFIHVVGKMEVL